MRQFVYKWKIRDNFIHNVEICVDNFAEFDKMPNFSSGSAPVRGRVGKNLSTIAKVLHRFPHCLSTTSPQKSGPSESGFFAPETLEKCAVLRYNGINENFRRRFPQINSHYYYYYYNFSFIIRIIKGERREQGGKYMKFVCSGLTLSEAVTKTVKACAVRTTTPILECIKLEATSEDVTLLATDGELSIRKTFKAEVFEEGEVCVPGKLFADFVGKLTDLELTLRTSERGLEICYSDSGSAIQTMPAEEFPKIDLSVGEWSFVMKSADLKRIIAETTFCCAQDDSRPILKGCLFDFKDKLEVTALDGYRLALATADVISKTGEKQLICPARTLLEISRMLEDDEKEVTLYSEGGMMMVSSGDMTVVSRLYTGDFIKKESVIPTSFTTKLTVDKLSLLASVERAAILIRGDKNNLVTLEISGGSVRVYSNSESGNVSESLLAETEGKDLTVSMNAKFLSDALRALKEDRITASFNGPVSPFIVENAGNKDSLYLILPVRNAQ